MTAAVITSGKIAPRIRNGTPVRLIKDFREGWVQDAKIIREALSDDPAHPNIVTRVEHYIVRLAGGRGNVAVAADGLQNLARDPRPPFTPKEIA